MSHVISNLTEQKPSKHKSVHSNAADVINGEIIMVQVFKTTLVSFCHYTPITMIYIFTIMQHLNHHSPPHRRFNNPLFLHYDFLMC